MSKPLIKASHITLLDEQGLLFKPVSFVLEAGAMLYLTGENGIGKSSLLKAIHQDLVDFGEVQYGVELKEIGWMPHHLPLYPSLNLKTHLDYFEKMVSCVPGYFAEAKANLSCDHLLRTPFGRLSQGQKQRASLLALLHFPVKILLLDEPMSHQDKHHQIAMQAIIDLIIDSGVAVLQTTHQPIYGKSIQLTKVVR